MATAIRAINIALLISALAVITSTQPSLQSPRQPFCSVAMYNDTRAYEACRTLDALQQNWFPSPIAGLFSFLDWNGFDGFWQNGVVLETIANFMHYTKSHRYKAVLKAAWRPLDDLVHAYFPCPSCDDEMWYGLAFARIYEVLRDERFLNTSIDIFNWTMTTCYDYSESCNGGVFFGDSGGLGGVERS